MRMMKNTRWMAAAAVAALLGVAACSAAPRTVSIRSAGDSTPLAADPEPATVDPTATTVEQPTTTTAPTATTAPTSVTQPTSSTTAAVTATTTAPVTASTVQPVTVTTAAVTPATTVAAPTVALTQVPSLALTGIAGSGAGGFCQMDRFFANAVSVPALQTTLAAGGLAVPSVLFRDKNGVAVPATEQNVDEAQRVLDKCVAGLGGNVPSSYLVVSGDSTLAQAVKAQIDGLGLKNYSGWRNAAGEPVGMVTVAPAA